MKRPVELVCADPDGNVRTIFVELSNAKPDFVVGRADDADFRLEHDLVGPRQFSLSLTRDGVELANLNDSLPLLCNGRRRESRAVDHPARRQLEIVGDHA